jgi:hypothetical protein
MLWGLFLFFVCCILFFSLSFYKNSGINPPFISILFALKIISGIGLLFVYTYYYQDRKTGDVFKYLDDSKIIWNYSKSNLVVYFKILFGIDNYSKEVVTVLNYLDHWHLDGNVNLINDSRLIIRFNLLLFPFSGGNQYIHLVVLGLWSFTGQVAMYRTFVLIFNEKIKSLIAVFFIPSFVFWSSGILKEGLLIGFLGLFLWYLFRVLKSGGKLHLLILIALWIGVLFSKFYVAFCLIPFAFIFICTSKLKVKIAILFGVIFCFFSYLFFTNNDSIIEKPLKLLSEKQRQFINVSKGGYFIEQENDTFRIEYNLGTRSIRMYGDSGYFIKKTVGYNFVNLRDAKHVELKAGKTNSFKILKKISGAKSSIEISAIDGIRSLIKNLPEYILNVLIRPFPRESKNIFQFTTLLENISVIICFLLALVWFKQPKQNEIVWMICFFFFVFLLFALIGATTPVIGAIVRYKIPALPFLWIIILIVIDESKFKNSLLKLKGTIM